MEAEGFEPPMSLSRFRSTGERLQPDSTMPPSKGQNDKPNSALIFIEQQMT